ncbi:MAG: 16S rRNA (guanine(966)-N(2))-methyltransferase RsmD [candidate division WOR-3 bacterium]|nr:MAG: 16S rRNA (guanine(966)-N(2))-methyltransferase RsmD [candidate division WOR-3 bacterium]
MRIVGGACKKRHLRVPGKGVRPTRGMIREAIFNILSERVVGALILDVFAGTGALGIEALSRGAKACTFVERRPGTLRTNLSTFELDRRVRVLSEDFRPALRRLRKQKFDVIFADPPYNRNYIQETVEMIERYALLAKGGMIVAEYSVLERYEIPEGFNVWKQKRYGDTSVSFIEHGNPV